jgi:hypothetical protein
VLTWLAAFVWTLVFEAPVYAVGLRRPARHWWEPLAWALALNLLTHPLFAWWVLGCGPSPGAVLGAEALIAATEGLVLALGLAGRCPPARAVTTAVAANGLSYGMGLLAPGWIG